MSDEVTVATATTVSVDPTDNMIKMTEHHYKDAFCSVILALACICIGYVTVLGSDHNSLHESAMTWCFFVILSILGGYGLGSIAGLLPNLPTMLTTRK